MSSTLLSPDEAEADHHDEHPSDAKYVKIAIILAVLTALEVATYFFEDSFNWGPILVIMMFVKGIIVAGYFMHLKFENRLLTRVFVSGFVLACFVYIIALSAFAFWTNSGLRDDYGVNARPVPYVDPDAIPESAESEEIDGERGEGEGTEGEVVGDEAVEPAGDTSDEE